MARHKDVPQGDFGPPMKFDPHFNGPVHRRSCTDIICLVLFLVFIGCWVATSIYAIGQGDVRKLLVPTDTEGRKCGLDSQVKDYPHLVFFDMKKCIDVNVPIYGCPTTQACVKKCPTTTFMASDSSQVDALEMDDIRDRLVCKPEIVISDIGSKDRMYQLMDSGDCARDVYRSKSISHRCIPRNITELAPAFVAIGSKEALLEAKEVEDNLNLLTEINQFGAMVIEDLVNARWWLLLSLFLVMIFCLFYITLMRWIAGPVTWFTMLAIVGLLSYSVYLTYDRYAFYRDNPVLLTGSDTNLAGVARSVTSMKETWLVLMIVAIITLVVILLMLIFLRKRIVLAIALIKEASRAVGSVKSTLFFPIFPWVLEVGLLAYGIVICLYLASIGDDNYRVAKLQTSTCSYTVGQKCDPDQFAIDCGGVDDAICHFTGIINPQYIYWLQALNVAAFFWSEFFVQGVGDMILAGVFATWYWTFKKSDVPFFALTRSIARTCFYNLGTVAFGSLIITICRLIRVCLEYIDQKTKKWDNGFTKCILCLCKCFFACLESFLKFINKNAYIMCAIHGKGFISSAKEAFSLLMRNVVRVFVLDKVTDFLFFLSKLVVAVLCGVAAYFALSSPKLYDLAADEQLHYDLTPAIVVGVAAYLIASVFFGVYAMAVDTLFLCFLEDCERNDGSPERPYFMSKQLMKILGKKNK